MVVLVVSTVLLDLGLDEDCAMGSVEFIDSASLVVPILRETRAER